MALFIISGCSRDKDIRFFCVPEVRINQGTEHEELN